MWKQAKSVDDKRRVMGSYGEGNISPQMRDAFINELKAANPEDRSTERFYWQSVSTLSHMLPDPVVEAWFTQVIQTSRSDRLANRAARALGVEWDSANSNQGNQGDQNRR